MSASRKYIVLSTANPAFEGTKYADLATAQSIARHRALTDGVRHVVAELISAFQPERSVRETPIGSDSEESE